MLEINEARLNELKPILVKDLEWLPDADPHVLADYIIKLLKRGDKDETELYNSCVNSLEGFLKEG